MTAVAPIQPMIISSARYQTATLLFVALLAGAALQRLVGPLLARKRRRPAGVAVLAVSLGLLVASSLGPWGKVLPARTIDLELRFLREVSAQLPPNAVFVHAEGATSGCHAVDRGLYRPRWLPAVERRPEQAWMEIAVWEAQRHRLGDVPAYYVHLASCDVDVVGRGAPTGGGCDGFEEANRRYLDECRAWLARYRAHPVAEAQLPARPYAHDHYTSDPVLVGIYEMQGP